MDWTVEQLAKRMGMAEQALRAQLAQANVTLEGDVITKAQRDQFLAFLQGGGDKLSLKRSAGGATLSLGGAASEAKVTTVRKRRAPTRHTTLSLGDAAEADVTTDTSDVTPDAAQDDVSSTPVVSERPTTSEAKLTPTPTPGKKGSGARTGTSKLKKAMGGSEPVAMSAAAVASSLMSARKTRVQSVSAKETLSHGFEKPTAPVVRKVLVPETIQVGELAQQMSMKASDLIKWMMSVGDMVTINQVLDQATAQFVVTELGHEAVLHVDDALEQDLQRRFEAEQTAGSVVVRPPVVTIMGHVDHGKTTLLDSIRRTKVASGEAGGITQHIGAYHVKVSGPESVGITFLDTPGHAAFTHMRARGAKVTDVVVLVVAGDDGVKPQTIEAIQHAKAAGVPMVVAVNKMDREDADLERVKGDLANHDVVAEDWGGDVVFQPLSAKTGEGLQALLETLELQAEMLELQAPNTGPARGVILEAKLDKGRGPVATLLVQQGALNRGDVLLAGQEFGRVRLLMDDAGQAIEQAGPSMPVEVLGLSGLPQAGDEGLVLGHEKEAREAADQRRAKKRDANMAKRKKARLDDVFNRMAPNGSAAEQQDIRLLLKGDVQGSVEAIANALEKLSNDDVRVTLVAQGVGGITESDATLAVASNAIVIGFNVRADKVARQLLEGEGVELIYCSVIYDLIERVESAMLGLVGPRKEERMIGLADVKAVFSSSKFGDVAGCVVMEGSIQRSAHIRVLRDHVVIFEGALESLRRFKDDVDEVKAGMECGLAVKDYDVKAGDQIEAFVIEEVLPKSLKASG